MTLMAFFQHNDAPGAGQKATKAESGQALAGGDILLAQRQETLADSQAAILPLNPETSITNNPGQSLKILAQLNKDGSGGQPAPDRVTKAFPEYLTFSDTNLGSPLPQETAQSTGLIYPEAPRRDVVEQHGDITVHDPYRWLEDLDSPETKAWVAAEQKLGRGVLDAKIEKLDNNLGVKAHDVLQQLADHEKVGTPEKAGNHYFYFSNPGLKPHEVWYVADSPTGPRRELLDPDKLSPDGTKSLDRYFISHDGKFFAYALSTKGSVWLEWHVRDVATGRDLPDKLEWSKFSSAAWTKDNKGFFYSKYDQPKNEAKDVTDFAKLYYHKLGTAQSQDKLICEDKKHPEIQFHSKTTQDGHFLTIVGEVGSDERNSFYYADLRHGTGQLEVIKLFEEQKAKYKFIGNHGTTFYFLSDLNNPKGSVIAVDLKSPKEVKEIIPASTSNDTMQDVKMIGGKFVVSYLHDAYAQARIYDMNGRSWQRVELPGMGTIGEFSGTEKDKRAFFAFETYTTPYNIYELDVHTGEMKTTFKPQINSDVKAKLDLDLNPDHYVTEQVFYTSKDGRTQIPMSITHKKGIAMDGKNPTLLFGYGGFGHSVTPFYRNSNLVFMSLGGILAVPNIRGGGEYGEDWHRAGMFEKKQNVFDDFIAAAEFLKKKGYTSTEKLAINGASNGGLLVGAVETQKPDLCATVITEIPVLDMARFHKFNNGDFWKGEYGNPDNPDDLKFLLAYSPVHNVQLGTRYPATLLLTGDHDNTVFPAHTFKFGAALQAAQTEYSQNSGNEDPPPIVIRVAKNVGHNSGSTMAESLNKATDQLAWLYTELHMDEQRPIAAQPGK